MHFEREQDWVFYDTSYTKDELPEPLEAYTQHPKLRPANKIYSGDVESIRKRVGMLRYYLLETTITKDKFGIDHDERVGFLQKLGAWEWYKGISKFTTANHFAVCGSMQQIMNTFEDILRKDEKMGESPDHVLDPLYNRLKAAYDGWNEWSGHKLLGWRYKTLGFDEKVALVNDLDAMVYKFLEILSLPVLAKSPALD